MVRSWKTRSNADYINNIRREAGGAFESSIPDPVKAGLQQSATAIMNYMPFRNEFADQLVNRIGSEYVHYQGFQNPLRKFKTENLLWGDTHEEINVGLTKAESYDPDRQALERDIFGRKVPDVRTAFHRINDQRYYPISIQEPMLRRAFVNEGGLNNLLSALMQSPITSDQRDEFLLMVNLFREWYRMGGFFRVQVPDVSATTSTKEDAESLLIQIREYAALLQYPETDYNPSRMPVSVDPDDLELFMTPRAKAVVDVKALAAAFNLGLAEIEQRITVVPDKYMPIPGVQAILTSRQFFVVKDSLFENTTAENPVGLHQNYFLHHHQVVSASPFVPAILFWTGQGDTIEIADPVVESVTLSVTDLDGNVVTELVRGEVYRMLSVVVTNPANGYNTAVRYELEPGYDQTGTYVRQTGTLAIAIDEGATELTINGYPTDTDFPQEVTPITLPIVGGVDGVPLADDERVQRWPNPGIVEVPAEPEPEPEP